MKSLARQILESIDREVPNQTPDMRRSPKGGVTGINGEYYKGGEFLPNSIHPKGIFGKYKKKSLGIIGRKREMKPYKWKVISKELYDYFDSQLDEEEYIKDIDGAYKSLPLVTFENGSKGHDVNTKYTWCAFINKDNKFVRRVYTEEFPEG